MARITKITLTLCALCTFAAAQQTEVFTDPRDGHKYLTVMMANKTWMAENLNHNTNKSWCYENNNSNCSKYGRLYDWNTAMRACPSGWRLPDSDDWDDLIQEAGGASSAGKMLKSKTGWSQNGNGMDVYGWSALPGGYGGPQGIFGGKKFMAVGTMGSWWSATEVGGYVVIRIINSNKDEMLELPYYKDIGQSVRCVKD